MLSQNINRPREPRKLGEIPGEGAWLDTCSTVTKSISFRGASRTAGPRGGSSGDGKWWAAVLKLPRCRIAQSLTRLRPASPSSPAALVAQGPGSISHKALLPMGELWLRTRTPLVIREAALEQSLHRGGQHGRRDRLVGHRKNASYRGAARIPGGCSGRSTPFAVVTARLLVP
jgi:hypothetical protein